MGIINTASLAATVDAVNLRLFLGQPIAQADRSAASKWIASRLGQLGSYRGMFAPTAGDFSKGIHLFTGEHVWTRAGTAHILGQEACRVLHLLRPKEQATRQALFQACSWLDLVKDGFYCCGKCSASYWRHLVVGTVSNPQDRLRDGLGRLKSCRTGDGQWKVFPFYYTLLAVAEIGPDLAAGELKYVAGRCERLLKRLRNGNGKFNARRATLLKRVLAMV